MHTSARLERPVVVSIDMHRGHLDAAVAALPLGDEPSRALIARAAPIYRELRALGVPIVQVVTRYRTPDESERNPFWASKRSGTRARSAEHNLFGTAGTEIVPELADPRDVVVDTKKRYSAFMFTDLDFVLRGFDARTVILTGVNTNSCVLCTCFETVNRDYDLVVLRDCVDTMDGPAAHEMAITLIQTCLGRVLTWPQLRPLLERAEAPA
ncbi:MAG: cysteine hydrolase family protein [Candidatus Velthaea sp.]